MDGEELVSAQHPIVIEVPDALHQSNSTKLVSRTTSKKTSRSMKVKAAGELAKERVTSKMRIIIVDQLMEQQSNQGQKLQPKIIVISDNHMIPATRQTPIEKRKRPT